MGFKIFNYIYVLFQSLSQLNFEKHIALYENNITILQNDLISIYHDDCYDLQTMLKIVFVGLIFLNLFLNKRKNTKLRNIIKKQKEEMTLQNEKMSNKIELLEENYSVIKNLLLDYDRKVNSSDISEIFKVNTVITDDDYEDEEDYDEDDDEDDEDDDEDIYEKYDKLSNENKKLKELLKVRDDKLSKIDEYTKLDYCRSARILTYIRDELKV